MELNERMAWTTEGQVTWADPELGKKCFQCVHADHKWPSAKNRKTHICTLVKLVSGRTGAPYDGKRAIACSKFAEVDKTTSK